MKKSLLFAAYLSVFIFTFGCKKDAEKDATLSYSFSVINRSATLSSTAALSGAVVPAETNGSINGLPLQLTSLTQVSPQNEKVQRFH
jgi:hypothetical protein